MSLEQSENYLEEIRPINGEEFEMIMKHAKKAIALIGADASVAPEENVRKISVYIDQLTKEGIIKKIDDISLRQLAFTLGSFWGCMVGAQYDWKWKFIKDTRRGLNGFFLISEGDIFCCPVHTYLYKILSGQNSNHGNHNTTLILFQMLEKLQVKNETEKYKIVW